MGRHDGDDGARSASSLKEQPEFVAPKSIWSTHGGVGLGTIAAQILSSAMQFCMFERKSIAIAKRTKPRTCFSNSTKTCGMNQAHLPRAATDVDGQDVGG